MIPIHSLNNIPQDEIKSQFKLFLQRLYEMTRFKLFLQRLYEMTRDIETKDLIGMDSKILISNFFDPSNSLFKDIEIIMQAIAVSAEKHSCESVLESFVSSYENHFDFRRASTNEETTNEEFEIAVNAPNLAHCDSIVKEAMDHYWHNRGGRWHFYRASVLEKDSTVVKRLKNTQNQPPFL